MLRCRAWKNQQHVLPARRILYKKKHLHPDSDLRCKWTIINKQTGSFLFSLVELTDTEASSNSIRTTAASTFSNVSAVTRTLNSSYTTWVSVPSDEEISTWKKEFKNKDLNAQHVS
jgi:hypothetical protein